MICYNWSPGEEPRPSILIPLGCGQRQKQNNMINNTATSLAKMLLQLKSEQQPAPQPASFCCHVTNLKICFAFIYFLPDLGPRADNLDNGRAPIYILVAATSSILYILKHSTAPQSLEIGGLCGGQSKF